MDADGELGAEAVCILEYLNWLGRWCLVFLQLETIQGKLQSESWAFLVWPAGNTVGPVEEYDRFFANVPLASVSHPYVYIDAMLYQLVPLQQQTIAFIDPSALPDNPGWPLRNLLAYLHALHPPPKSVFWVGGMLSCLLTAGCGRVGLVFWVLALQEGTRGWILVRWGGRKMFEGNWGLGLGLLIWHRWWTLQGMLSSVV